MSDYPNVQSPPHNDDAERSLLGAVFVDPRIIAGVRRELRAVDFYREPHRTLFRWMLKLVDRGQTIDVVVLADALDAAGELDEIGGAGFVAKISHAIPSAKNWQYYARIVSKHARVRRFISTMQRRVGQAYGLSQDADEFFSDVAGDVASVIRSPRAESYVSFGHAMNEFLDDYELREQGLVEPGMSSGCATLDDLVGGWHTGRSVMVAGLSKQGKTKFTAQAVLGLALENDVAVDWYSVEMPATAMIRRALSWQGGINESALRDPRAAGAHESMAHQRRLMRARANLASLAERVRFYNWSKPRLEDILLNTDARLAELDGERPLVVVVDYLQRVDAGYTSSNAEYMNVTAASQALTGAAIEKGFLGVYVTHFSRSGARRKGLPRPSDARGSGAIEQDCDHFLVVHRPFWEAVGTDDESELARSFTVVWQSLNRHGPVGTAFLQADLGRNVFTRWQYEIPDYLEVGGRD